MKLYNHIAPGLSKLEWEMVQHIPAGGNWQNIPDTIPSQRLEQIRRSGGRTTYYGRLEFDKPSYTITTYFNRLGNGCNLHPSQDRIISTREGARLQSFKDSFIFYGSKTSQYKQIGNAVPPLLARAIAETLKSHLKNLTFIDLFAGAGGMSEGFLSEGFKLIAANEIEPNFFETYKKNHSEFDNGNNLILGDITSQEIKEQIISVAAKQKKIGVIIGGPPCQGFSHAGWRNPDDKRNQLFKEFVYVVEEIRPEIFVMENVPGILTMRKGAAMKEIISSFEEIGYHVSTPFKLNAEDFGVPQKRRRVVIIGSLKKEKFSQPKILFSHKDESKPKPITVKQAIGGLPILTTGSGEFEMTCNYKPTSAFEKLMLGEIDFATFYESCLDQLPVAFRNVG
ncbi:MAG: DNA (cytosine-5-)-methyltransferase [Bacteroidetes bacterium]|uniref:DNA (cytosine-5-)-methyltransferase n=1 Tax=Phnomibacter sp. TaxID=2836217 RepID=UPI002FDE4136|nr:DNA (cytosine-5-)-methyltransferase [Bacteroidota bacterium]